MGVTIRYIERSSFSSIDSMPIRDVGLEMLDLNHVRAHIDHDLEHNRYSGPTDPIQYLRLKGCLIADGDGLFVTPAGLLCFGQNPQDILPHAVVNLTHYRGTTPDSTDAV